MNLLQPVIIERYFIKHASLFSVAIRPFLSGTTGPSGGIRGSGQQMKTQSCLPSPVRCIDCRKDARTFWVVWKEPRVYTALMSNLWWEDGRLHYRLANSEIPSFVPLLPVETPLLLFSGFEGVSRFMVHLGISKWCPRRYRLLSTSDKIIEIFHQRTEVSLI